MTGPLAPASISSPSSPGGLNPRGLPLTEAQRNRANADPEVVKAAEGFEAIFMDQMMKSMRQTVPKSDMDLESPASEIYRSMLDSEYADKAAKAGGVGLADMIIAYWTQKSGGGYTGTQGQPHGAGAAASRTGGRDAGQSIER